MEECLIQKPVAASEGLLWRTQRLPIVFVRQLSEFLVKQIKPSILFDPCLIFIFKFDQESPCLSEKRFPFHRKTYLLQFHQVLSDVRLQLMVFGTLPKQISTCPQSIL